VQERSPDFKENTTSMKKISRLIKSIVLGSVCHVFLGMSFNLAASLPDEKTIVNTIFGEVQKYVIKFFLLTVYS
jgi:hypothetical protein